MINLIEIYPSIQGETSFTGLPTTFIRLAACNLRCTWCDTPYSFGRGEPWEIDAIIRRVEEFGCSHVCITGGEPLLQKGVHLLMERLCDQNFQLSLETGGSLPIDKVDPRVTVILDIKCPGSGMSGRNLWSNIDHLKKKDEIKFVIKDETDYLWTKKTVREYNLSMKVDTILLSPVFDELDPKHLVGWMIEDQLPARLNLQVHKYIWNADTKGV